MIQYSRKRSIIYWTSKKECERRDRKKVVLVRAKKEIIRFE